jgi:hypothetical protein
MIEIIGDNGFSSFTILKKELKVSTGTIYHHLDALSQLIEQKSDKKYYLTDLGQLAYNSLKENITNITRDISNKEFNSPILKALMYLTPKRFINNSNPLNYILLVISLLILVIGAVFCYLTNLFPFFLLFSSFPNYENLQAPFTNILGAILFILNYLVYFFIVEGIIRLVFKNKNNTKEFFKTFAFIFIPSDFFLIIHYAFRVLNLIELPSISILDNIIMILLQAWSLWILTYSISTYKQLKIENALILSLLLHYGGFSVILTLAI